MSDDTSAFSRRKMITGLGVSMGAVAASGLLLPEAAGAAAGGSSGAGLLGGVSSDATFVPESLVMSPGLAYTALNAFAFRADNGGPVVVGTYGAYSGSYLVAQLHVPHGAVLREIDVWGMGLALVDIYRSPHDLRTLVPVKQVAILGGSGMQTVREAIADEAVNLADNSYVVIANAPSSATGINAVRVGYRPASVMTPITPIARVLDTRSGARLAAGSDTVVPLGLPAAARTAIITLTVTQTTGTSGYVGVYPAAVDARWPGNSNINWFGPDQNLATGITTAVSSFGAVILHVGENATHVIVDVQGYLG